MTDPWLATGRGALLLGVLLLVGVAVCTRLSPPRAIAAGLRTAAALIAVGLGVQLVGQLRAFDAFAEDAEPLADTLAMIAATAWGRNRMYMLAIALTVAVVAVAWRRLGVGGARALALAALLLLPLLGHTAAVEEHFLRSYALAVTHAMAAGAWLGTLLLLGRPWWHGVEAVRPAVPSYGRLALVAAPLTVLTGVLTAWPRVGGVSGLFAGGYGALLLTKLALVGAVLALGARHHRRLVRAGEAPSRGTLLAEVAGALLVLGVTGWLAESAPPM